MKFNHLELRLASQPRVCQHCWSKAATTSDPDLCGDCGQEWRYLLECAHKQGASPLSTALNMRNHHE